jgi:hypothetical protein
VRRAIPKLLGALAGPRAIAALVAALGDPDEKVRERSIDALHRARWRRRTLKPLTRSQLVREIQDGASDYEEVLSGKLSLAADPSGSASVAWLTDVLDQECDRILESIFKLLALEYPVTDMRRTYLAVRDATPARLANGVELLDNLLPKVLKARLVPLLESSVQGSATVAASLKLTTTDGALRRLAENRNAWIAACGLHAAREKDVSGLDEIAGRASVSGDPVLREEGLAFVAARAGGG